MKSALISVLLLYSTLVLSHTKLQYIDPEETFNNAIEAYSAGDTVYALELLDLINENDSIYISAIETKLSILLDKKEYETVIKTSDYFIKTVDNPYSFYINKGVAQLRKEDYESAAQTFKKALVKYPMSYLLYYNLGITYENIKEYQKAIDAFQKSILLNPYYAQPHMRMAWMCYRENLITQAVLCWDMYLLLNPTANNSIDVLVLLNNAVSQKNETEALGINISKDDKAFEEIDIIVNNYAALNKGYKIDNKITLPLVKQNHAIMEKLNTFEGEGGFWSEKYVPFFKKLYNEGKFNEFVYRIMLSSSSEKHQKIIAKNAKNQKEFLGWSGNNLVKMIGTGNSDFWGNKVDNFYYQSSGVIYAVGVADNQNNFEGPFAFYTKNGALLSNGYFTNDKRDKQWIWYYLNGNIETKAMYSAGEHEGPFTDFHPDGKLKLKTTYKNSYYHDTLWKYNLFGALIEKSVYNEGELTGTRLLNYDLGEKHKKYVLNYTDNKLNGESYQYFVSGEKMVDMSFENGMRVNEEKQYFRNGQLSYLYNYVNNNLQGEYRSYYFDGILEAEGQYNEGYRIGQWKSYYQNGKLSTESNYDEKGRLTGIYREYDLDGKLHLEFEYNKDELIAYKYFDKDGNVLVDERKQNKAFYFKGFHSNGIQNSEGKYKIEGAKEGKWNYYDQYGILTSTEEYNDGYVVNADEEFFVDGSQSSKTMYESGLKEGYYESYFENGTLAIEGYYKNDLAERIWHYYYPDGTLQLKRYFKNDKLNGFQYKYYVDGRLAEKEYYKDGFILYSVYFDSLENVVDTIDYRNVNNKIFNYPDGSKLSESNYLNGHAHGVFTWYHPNGKVRTLGEYYNGQLHGTWRWWNDKGQLTSEDNYIHGVQNGLAKDFHDNGQLASVSTYLNNEKNGWSVDFSESGDTIYKAWFYQGTTHGPANFYSEKGELQLVRYYRYGELLGYSYLNAENKLVDMIPIENGTGKITSYYPNGNKAREIGLLGVEFHGKYIKYHSNGTVAEDEEFVLGARQGDHFEYYSNKQLKVKCSYLNDHLHGTYLKYHENGQLAEERYYINDGISGKAKYYDESGKLIKALYYYNDHIYEAKYF